MAQKKILVVDKDTENLSLMESRLGARDFSVRTARTSMEALDILKAEVFDLILLSAKMELVNGEELSETIRKTVLTCFIPVIMMIGPEDLAELIHGTEMGGFDDFLMVPFDPLTLQLRIHMNMKRAEERLQANPLTKLPGNTAIEKAIKDRIAAEVFFSVCYIDVNNFKSFNDIYGYEKGDEALLNVSRIIVQSAKKHDPATFVGHVGGDDFIVLLDPAREAQFAKELIQEFDRIMPGYYSHEDQRRGYVTVKNRKGRTERFPVMSLSIAAVTNLYRRFTNPGEIAQVAAEVKKFLKTQSGSHYLRDRRERQLEKLDEAFEILSPAESEQKKITEPLGKFLLSAGLIDERELDLALKRQYETGERLGQVLIAMNLVKSQEVGRMLEKKLGVPYISLTAREPSRETARLFTAEYVKTHRVIPIEVHEGSLQLAMLDPFDIRLIDDIERTTGLRVVPGLALEEEFEQFLERYYNKKAETA